MQSRHMLAAFAVGAIGGAGLVAAAPLAAFDPPAAAHGPDHGGQAGREGSELGHRGCAYFEHADYGGQRGDLADGESIEWIGPRWNDRISAVSCAPGCRLLGYEHINYGGARRSFRGDTAYVGDFWNDRISALRVVCLSPSFHR